MAAHEERDALPYVAPYAPGHRVTEYRFELPVDMDEYHRAQHYMTGKTTMEETSKGDSGVELIKIEPFEKAEYGGKGVYSEKIYHLRSRMPAIARKVLPASAQVLYEYCWNAYPYIRTELRLPFLKKASLIIISFHAPSSESVLDNACGLNEEQLAARNIVSFDIAADAESIPAKDYKPENDPTKVTSQLTDRLPLASDWKDKESRMVVYKACLATFKYTGVQKKLETTALKEYHNVFLATHCQLVAWLDEWVEKTYDECIEFEQSALAAANASPNNDDDDRPSN